MLNALRDTHAAKAATAMGGEFLRDALREAPQDTLHEGESR